MFTKCLDKCAPIVTRAVKGRPAPWMSDKIREVMQDRNELQQELKIDHDNSSLRERYKTAKNNVKTLIRNTTADHYRDRLKECKGNTSATWKVIKEIIPSHKNTPHAYKFSNPRDKAEELNKFFSNVGESTLKRSHEELKIEDEFVGNGPHPDIDVNAAFRPQPVDTNTVILAVKDLNTTTSVGSDNIGLRFLRDALCNIFSFLTCIINTSMVTGVFPAAWKHALVVPLFKNGDRDCVNNYRPASLLPIVSKVLEKIVVKQLSYYLESNKLFPNC